MFVGGNESSLAFQTGSSYLSFIAYFFVCIGLKALTDGVLRGSGDVVVFTLANLCNLAVRVSIAFIDVYKRQIFDKRTGKWNTGFIGIADGMGNSGIWNSGDNIWSDIVKCITFCKHSTAFVTHFFYICLLYTSRHE